SRPDLQAIIEGESGQGMLFGCFWNRCVPVEEQSRTCDYYSAHEDTRVSNDSARKSFSWFVPVRDVCNRSDKAVSAPRNGFNEPGIIRIIRQCLTQFVDRDTKPMLKIHERVRRPQLLTQLLAGNYFSSTSQKDSQNTERL